MFGLGPIYMFMLQHRLPVGLMRDGWRPWLSTMLTNLGDRRDRRGADLLHRHQGLPAGASADHRCWRRRPASGCSTSSISSRRRCGRRTASWNRHEAALHGSSHYDLPGVLRWITANIGVHHVHHLSSGIPFYRLRDVLRDHPELGAVGRLTLLQSFGCIRLVLWDEASRKLISFRELRAPPRRRLSRNSQQRTTVISRSPSAAGTVTRSERQASPIFLARAGKARRRTGAGADPLIVRRSVGGAVDRDRSGRIVRACRYSLAAVAIAGERDSQPRWSRSHTATRDDSGARARANGGADGRAGRGRAHRRGGSPGECARDAGTAWTR